MNKESLILLRDKFKNYKLNIFIDNELRIDLSLTNFTKLIWDDTNSVLYEIRINNSLTDNKTPYTIRAHVYEDIQMISILVNEQDLLKEVTKLNMSPEDKALLEKDLISFRNYV